ncbi:hypothetical protein MYAM1_003979 [Malassezia yamatoensis]|uniref:triacylglycerol lipase n=1 Tax=Malassezia yamatoensis TaxID=253288 RepID=A0AAJ6CKY6_9BASI|nr:hypothetical protein MYAM1_003979 [Malassezia yamatoensis]
MISLRLILIALVAVLLSPGALARMSVAHRLAGRAIPVPEDDSFYTPNDGWESESPGTILKEREVTVANSGIFKYNVRGFQLLYRTNGVDSSDATHSVTTVLVPDNYDVDKLVSANLYEDSFSSDCAPSYSIRAGSKVFNDVNNAYQELFITTLLHQGWVVTVPDHEGPDNAFTSGRVEGHIVLDGIRATLNFKKVGLKSRAKVVGYGYSGGALATGWAASLHSQYASEINAAGWSMGGTVTNVTEWLQYIDNTSGSGFALAALGGLSSSYSSLKWVQDNLTSKGRKLLNAAKTNCLYQNLWATGTQKIFDDSVFSGGSSFFSNSDATSILNKLTLGRFSKLRPIAPVFIYHATHDEVVPFDMAESTANAWCQQGAQVRFLSETGSELAHANTELANLPNVIFFMRDRFKGKSWGANCQYPSTSDPWFDPYVLGQNVADFLQQVLDLAGNRIGNNDSILNHKVKHKQTP